MILLFFFFKDFIYLFTRDTQREAETQAEGEAGSLRILMWDSIPGPRSHPELNGDTQPLSHPGVPYELNF